MTIRWISFRGWRVLLLATLALPQVSWAHVTLQSSQPLRPGGSGTVTLNVPNERHVDNTKVTLTVPEAFLEAGGRLNRLIYPAGWTVTLESQEKPSEVYKEDMDNRARRDAERQQQAGGEHDAPAAMTEEEKQEQQAMDEMRKQWITKVIFESGAIPPSGYQQFTMNFQMPQEPGRYRFAAVQTYADGKEVSWSELVEGAEHPAATLNVQTPPWLTYADLPVPVSALALLIAVAAFFKKSRVKRSETFASAVAAPGHLASVRGE